jgi:hypothetical protein
MYQMSIKLLTQEQVDEIVRMYKGKRAVEKPLLKQSGKHGHYQRFLLDDGSVFHINTRTGTLTVTPPAKAEVSK